MKLCYSSGSSCELDVVVLQGFKLPKPLCNFAGGMFAIQDFSLSKWISDKKADLQGASLEQWAIDLLKSELKISNFLLNPACSRASFSVGEGNWNLASCPSAPSIPALPGHTSCSLASFCSGVVCCTDIALLKTSIQSEVKIDRCKGKVFITLEKLEVVIILTKFEFSTWQKYTLQNVFRLE